MKLSEAQAIFRDYQDYIEIHDKLRQIFLMLPKSLLPHPINVLEKAINVVAKDAHDSGDYAMVENIQGHAILVLGSHIDDDKALENMHKTLTMIVSNNILKQAKLKSLKDTNLSWSKIHTINKQ